MSLTFYPSDMHLFEYLDGLGTSKAGYLKKLLAEDAERKAPRNEGTHGCLFSCPERAGKVIRERRAE